MSTVDSSDEDSSSCSSSGQASGSQSLSAGDTLPWNLPRHHRMKRKVATDGVLDPADRAVIRLAAGAARDSATVEARMVVDAPLFGAASSSSSSSSPPPRSSLTRLG
ncbi:uncharacterized protein LOC144931702 [Lampetra fluviatilis]